MSGNDTGLLKGIPEKFKDIFVRYKKTFVGVVAFGVLLYAFFMVNQLTNVGDGFWQQDYYLSGDVETSSGRWLWPYIDKLVCGLHVEPLTTLLSIVLFAAGYVMLLDALKVKASNLACILGGMVFMSSPVFSAILSYRFMSTAYALAFVLASISVFLCMELGNAVAGVISAAVLLAMSMGLYQSYLGVFCLVGLLAIIREAVVIRDSSCKKKSCSEDDGCGPDNKAPLDKTASDKKNTGRINGLHSDNVICRTLQMALRLLASVVAGGGLYYAMVQLHLKLRGVKLSDYNGVGDVSLGQIILNLPDSMKGATGLFIRYIKGRIMYQNAFERFHVTALFHVILIAALLVVLVWQCIRTKNIIGAVIAVICMLLIPSGCNAASLLAPGAGFMPQMGFPMALFSGMLVVLAGEVAGRLKISAVTGKAFIAIMMVLGMVTIYGQSAQTLTDHLSMKDGYTSVTTLANGVLDDLREKNILGNGKKVFFIGSPARNETFYRSDAFEKANEYAHVGSFWLEGHNMYASYKALFQRVMGVNLEVLSDTYESKAYDEYYQTIPCYPNEGYIIDWDTVIIKISEP